MLLHYRLAIVRPDLRLDLHARLPRPQRRLWLGREMLHVNDRTARRAPLRLQARDVGLEVGIVAMVLDGVIVHAALDINDQ